MPFLTRKTGLIPDEKQTCFIADSKSHGPSRYIYNENIMGKIFFFVFPPTIFPDDCWAKEPRHSEAILAKKRYTLIPLSVARVL